MKIKFTIVFVLLSLTAFSQVSLTNSLLNIGNRTPAIAPIPHNILVGVSTANEVARLEKLQFPEIRFINNNEIKFFLSGTLLSTDGLQFRTEGARKISFENAISGANSFEFSTAGINSLQDLQVNQGLRLLGPLSVISSHGSAGQILTSRGGSISPIWATTHDDPQVSVNAYIDYTLNLTHNISESLNNFTIENETYPPYLSDSFDESTGFFTAPSAGLYHFDLYVSWFDVASDKATIKINLIKDGSPFKVMAEDFGKNGSTNNFLNEIHLSQNIYLNQNSTVNFSLEQTNSNSLTVSIVPTFNYKKIKLGIYQIYNN